MSATLIAVIAALALGHLLPGFAAAVRGHGGYGAWLAWLSARFTDEHSVWRGRYGVLIALLPPVVLVALVQYVLQSPLAGLLGLLFSIAVLFYAWGPRDLDQDVADVADAATAEARR